MDLNEIATPTSHKQHSQRRSSLWGLFPWSSTKKATEPDQLQNNDLPEKELESVESEALETVPSSQKDTSKPSALPKPMLKRIPSPPSGKDQNTPTAAKIHNLSSVQKSPSPLQNVAFTLSSSPLSESRLNSNLPFASPAAEPLEPTELQDDIEITMLEDTSFALADDMDEDLNLVTRPRQCLSNSTSMLNINEAEIQLDESNETNDLKLLQTDETPVTKIEYLDSSTNEVKDGDLKSLTVDDCYTFQNQFQFDPQIPSTSNSSEDISKCQFNFDQFEIAELNTPKSREKSRTAAPLLEFDPIQASAKKQDWMMTFDSPDNLKPNQQHNQQKPKSLKPYQSLLDCEPDSPLSIVRFTQVNTLSYFSAGFR